MSTPKISRYGLLFAGFTALAACATAPGHPPPAKPAPPSVEVYFYPAKGQSKAQQERDRYECYLWARDQTGFDPSLPPLAPGQQADVNAEPSGDQPVAGAMAGAVIGAITAPRGEKREGAVKGAIAGAILGGMAQEADQREAERRAQLDRASLNNQLSKQAAEYRRAMTACLEGRGYTVK